MATLNGQKQQLLNQVKNSPNIELTTLVELVKKYDDLSIEDFNGIIPELLYAELLEAGRDPRETALWQEITTAAQNTPEDIQKLQRMVVQYQSDFPDAPMVGEASRMMTDLQQKLQILIDKRNKEIAAQREQNDWIILEKGNYNALHMYKQKYPNSVHLDELDDLMWTNSTIVVSMHSLNRYLTDWPNGKHAAEARQGLAEISEWEGIKRSRDIFKVDYYRDNHPYSVFKNEIDQLYYELRDEVLKDMKANPAEYSKGDIDKYIAADIFTLYDLIDNELMTDESWEVLVKGRDEYPDIAEYQIEDPDLRVPEDGTDIYFFGTPGSGKTCLLMGLSGADGNGYDLNLKTPGGAYVSALQQYVQAGITPGRTFSNFVTVINGNINRTGKRGNVTKYPINLVEMSGEEFALRIAETKEVNLANMCTGATNLLKNNNRKMFFIIIDPTSFNAKVDYYFEEKDANGIVTGYRIRKNIVSQLDVIMKFISILMSPENAEIMKRVDTIDFIVTKADTLGETVEECKERAKELLQSTYQAPVNALMDLCRQTKRINSATGYRPRVFTFSLGKFYLGGVFDFNDTGALEIMDSIRHSRPKTGWWERLSTIFR